MKLRSAIYGFVLITFVYLGALFWLDSERKVFESFDQLWDSLPLLVVVAFLAFLLRYARWYWLLLRSGRRIPIVKGYLCYLSGFAFTATPGKVGELIRIRYFLPMGVKPELTFSTFVYERACDLLVVLVLSVFIAGKRQMFVVVFVFVISMVSLLAFLIFKPDLLIRSQIQTGRIGLKRIAKILRSLRVGLAGCRRWLNFRDIVFSLTLGGLAWGLLSASFVYLCSKLGIVIPLGEGLSMYPISMLAGAASMIPGGLASTEGTIVALLVSYGVDVSKATIAAVGIRLTTLWFSIVCGFLSVGLLEYVDGNIQLTRK